MQHGRSIEGASSFHIEEIGGALRLYLPKDEVGHDVCFESDLPRRLCVYLEITVPGAPGVIGGVFRKDSLAVIDKSSRTQGWAKLTATVLLWMKSLGRQKVNQTVRLLSMRPATSGFPL